MMGRRKHKPQRTCVGCGQVEDKSLLVRVVRTPEGVFVDPTGKQSGRGAYLHPRPDCWREGLNSSLAHALRRTLREEDKERLKAYLSKLEEGEGQE